MSEEKRLLEKLQQYIHLVHTQEESDGVGLWADECEVSLISGANRFVGKRAIQDEFLGLIHGLYEKIDLISESVDVRLLNEQCALIIFAYHTDCIRRESGEPYGIAGLETQVYILENGDWRLVHVQYSGVPRG
ncbi:MAG: nuclear transport factor 2 family protein [Firmicutes bacterium]|nr:nuclear transport factor 2 family protein [Bacillota bacterium]